MAEETAGESIGTARIDVVVNTSQMDVAIEKSKRAYKDVGQTATSAYEQVNAAEKRRIASLERQIATLGKSREEIIRWRIEQQASGKVADDLRAKLDAQVASLKKTGDQFFVSSAQQAAAIRMVPAQVTDIFVGLATGQRPLTVLLQQGGQLKDMFGGIAPAAKALGTSLLGLINPVTLTAAGIAAVVAVAASGEMALGRLEDIVRKTGGAAGISAQALDSMAVSVGRSTNEFGKSRDAVEALAGNGKFSGVGLSGLAVAAVNVSKVTGDAVEKVVETFGQIADKPTEAIAKLNEQYHFLTSAEYAQIAALESEGRSRDAARAAMAAYTTAMADRARDVESNANWIVRSAHWVADEWGKAWQAVKGGIKDTLDPGLGAQAAALEAEIARLSRPRVDHAGNLVQANNGAEIAKLQQQLQAIRRQQVEDAFAESARADQAQANEEAIAAQQRLRQYASPKTTLDNELKQAAKDRAAALYGIVDPKTKAEIESEFQTRVREAKLAYDQAIKKLAGPTQKDPFATLNGLVQTAQVEDSNFGLGNGQQTEQVKRILAIVDAGAKLIQSGQDVAAVQAKVAAGVRAVNELYDKQADQLHQQNVVALDAYRAAMEKSNAALQEQMDNDVARIGMGQREYELQQKITEVYREQADRLEQVAIKQKEFASTGGKSGLSQADADAMTQVIRDETDSRVKIVENGYDRMSAAQSDWRNGARRALSDITDRAKDAAGSFYDFVGSINSDLADFITQAATTGKASIKDFVSSILKEVARLEANKAAAQLLSWGLSYFLPSSASGAGDALNGGSNYTGPGSLSTSWGGPYSYNAAGGIYASPDLSRYSGHVVDRPTLFAFARGAGVMGEAGPEAIMPLRRGPDGRLGVAAAGGLGNINFSQSITINSDGSSSVDQSADNQQDLMRRFGDSMRQVALNEIGVQMRPGGILWRGGVGARA